MKKKTILNVLKGLCAVLFLANCGGDSASDGPTLSVSPTSVTLGDSNSETINVTSNTDWSVSRGDSWVNCSPSSGTGSRQVTVSANSTSATDRTTYLTFTDKTGTKSVTVQVTQKGTSPTPTPDPTLTVSPSTLNFDYSSGSKTFTITSNLSWTVGSDKSWCTVSQGSGSNGATITVNVAANPDNSSRSATITVQGGSITRTISVTQEAKPVDYYLTVDQTSLSLAADGETKSISVSSNDSWRVSSDQAWCTVSPSEGNNNGTVNVSASKNTTTNSRSATITIKGDKSGITRTVSVSQEKPADGVDIGRDDYGSDLNLNNK